MSLYEDGYVKTDTDRMPSEVRGKDWGDAGRAEAQPALVTQGDGRGEGGSSPGTLKESMALPPSP